MSLPQKWHMVVAQAHKEMINLPSLKVFKTCVEKFMVGFTKCWQQPCSKQDVRLAIPAHLQSHGSGMHFIMLCITQTAHAEHSFNFLSYLACTSGRTGGDALTACLVAAYTVLLQWEEGFEKPHSVRAPWQDRVLHSSPSTTQLLCQLQNPWRNTTHCCSPTAES